MINGIFLEVSFIEQFPLRKNDGRCLTEPIVKIHNPKWYWLKK